MLNNTYNLGLQRLRDAITAIFYWLQMHLNVEFRLRSDQKLLVNKTSYSFEKAMGVKIKQSGRSGPEY
jgi:hypothetical protein